MTSVRFLLLVLFVLTLRASEDGYQWNLPEGFPPPPVPPSNPMTAAKVELGRYLFYDSRMSLNGRQSCGSCHIQRLAFTDGKQHAVGATGQAHSRNSMSLINVAWNKTFTWNNPGITTLEDQMRVPMFGTSPVELGMDPAAFLTSARGDKQYQKLFPRAFPLNPDPYTISNVILAIASFERTIIAARSSWDADWLQIRRLHDLAADMNQSSEAARRGEVLFFGDKLACGNCHNGNNFNATISSVNRLETGADGFRNNGLASGAAGLSEYTKNPLDFGKFKVPTLRNIALTAPYMHDGSLPTIDAVIDHYAMGGQHTPEQSRLVRRFALSKSERADLVAFLNSLTDEEVLRDPKLSDPWGLDEQSRHIRR